MWKKVSKLKKSTILSTEYSDILDGAVILSIDGLKAKDMETVSSYLAKKENQKARYQIISKNGQMYSIIM